MTAAEDDESRAVFELITRSNSTDVMTVHQLKLCLRALGFELSKGEARELVYEFDYDDSGIIRLADFQKIFLFKVILQTLRVFWHGDLTLWVVIAGSRTRCSPDV